MIRRHPALFAGAGAVLLAILSLPIWNVEPEFDAWVWLIWGRELNGLDLTTSAGEFAIAWKPFPVLLAALYDFAGDAAPDLWVVTVRASAIAAVMLAYRIGDRLEGPGAGVVAAVALLLVPGFVYEVAKADSEPVLIALALGAVELHLGGRRTMAFVALALAALIRPEAWPFLAVYGVLLWRDRPAARPLIAVTALAVPALWFGSDLIDSGEPLIGPGRARVGENTLTDALDHAVSALTLPIWVLVGVGIFADRPGRLRELAGHPAFVLGLVGIVWLSLVVILGALGYPGTERFAIVPAALLCPVAGTGAAWAVGEIVDGRIRIAAAIVLVALAVPLAAERIDATGDQIDQIPGEQVDAALEALEIAGADRRLAACNGRLTVGDARIVPRLAYELGLPMARVRPPAALTPAGQPGITLIRPEPFPAEALFQGLVEPGQGAVRVAVTPTWVVYALECPA